MDCESSLHALFGRLREPFTGEPLFDHLPDIVYFIKNSRCQYVAANRTLVERCGLRDKSQLLGRTPSEVFRPPLGERFEAQDLRVLKTGRALIRQLELHLYPSHDVGWCLTSKLPLLAADGAPVGLVGVSQDLRLPDVSAQEFQNVLAAVSYAEEHLATPPTVGELAQIAGLSRFQLDRRMRRVFGLTPGQWLLKLRLDYAQRMLSETSEPIAGLALGAGYSDQSAFTRQFRQATGLSPREYRKARGTGAAEKGSRSG
ncbi:MAG: helix-turn-helix domain-containing protein [Armatimonadota bacterium]